MGKLFESLLLDKLKTTLMPKIRNEQFGFRKQHSTIEQLTKVMNYVISHSNKKQKTVMIFLIYKKLLTESGTTV